MNSDAKTFRVTEIKKEARALSYVVQIESADGAVEVRMPFSLRFNKDVLIYNSSILYMFETIFNAPQNKKNTGRYRLQVDLEPDVDLAALRADYTNFLLADGDRLDSHAIRLLAGDCKYLKYATLVDFKGEELESIDRSEYDTDDSVLISGEDYLRNRSIQNVRLDFIHNGNGLYLLMLLIDHFKARKVLTADTENALISFYGKKTELYTCNFICGDIGTAYINAMMDPDRYFDRLLKCGFYPPFKNLRKYLTAKFLESRYGVKIFTPEREDAFFNVNKIDIAGGPGLLETLKSYKKQKQVGTGLQLFDVYLLTLNEVDADALRKRLVHNPEQGKVFDEAMQFARQEYEANKKALDGFRLFDFARLKEAFGDEKDAPFYQEVYRNLRRLQKTNPRVGQGLRMSFVMAAYNRAFCIERSINSFLRQSADDAELIVVDDGSSDGTEALVAKTYAAEIAQGRIQFVRTAHNGVCKARNVGLSLARGEWIAYLDSDNEIVPDFIETVKGAIATNPESEAFYAKLEFMSSHRIIGRAFDYDQLRYHNFIDLGTYVHHRSLYETEGGFDENMTRLVDWELIVRYSAHHTPVFIDKVLLHYEDSEETNRITNLGRSSYYVNLNYLRRKHCADYPLVTTAVTTYNHEKFIAQALDSAVAQEGRFIHEILVSDDCSTDGTRAIIRDYADRNPGLVLDISGDANLGISGNMRKCIATAHGKYIAWLEGDDYWISASKLRAQVDFLEARSDCPMVFCALKLLTPKGLSSGRRKYEALSERVSGADFFKPPSYMGVIGNFSTCMFRSELVKSLPESLYKYRLSEIALAFYLERIGALGFIREEYTVYRQHAGGVWSGAGKFGQFLQRVRCREQVKEVCRDEYVPLVDADIVKVEAEFQRYIDKAVSMCHAFEKQALGAERQNVGLKNKLEVETASIMAMKSRLVADERSRAEMLSKLKKSSLICRGLQAEVNALKASESYRVGMFVTWPARKAWGGVKCLRENGIKYTVKHAAGKVLRLFGSTCKW